MTREELASFPTSKVVEIAILGQHVEIHQAAEIIRRTDSFFLNDRVRSPEAEHLRAQMGVPSRTQLAGKVQSDMDGTFGCWTASKAFRVRWGAIDLHWLMNATVLSANGWCHPDGAICIAERSGRYPLALDYLEDAEAIGAAFPFLKMHIAVWATSNILPDRTIDSAPRECWPRELREKVSRPGFGLIVADGVVKIVNGGDRRLFDGFGIRPSDAAEIALREFRLRRESGLRARLTAGIARGATIPAAMVSSWIETSRALGLRE